MIIRNKRLLLFALFIMVSLVVTLLLASDGFASPPATSGAVMRVEDLNLVFTIDTQQGISVVQGFDIVALCRGDDPAFQLSQWQIVDIPSDPSRLVGLSTAGDLATSVWPFVIDLSDPAGTCINVLTTVPLATGMAELTLTDNDILAANNPNANAWGWNSHGTLTAADGSSVPFSAHLHHVDVNDGTIQENVQVTLP